MAESGHGLQEKRGVSRERRGFREFSIHLAVLSLVFTFACLAYLGFSKREPLSIQSRTMLARSETYEKAVQPGIWPPGYPLVLLLGRTAGLPPRTTNLLLFYASLLLLGILSRQLFAESRPVWAVLLYATCAFNYYNLSQFTSEALVVPLSLAAASLLLLYLKKKTFPVLLGLSACCAAVFVSRYHALAWLLPLFVGHLLFPLKRIGRRSIGHLAVFGLIALVPIGLVMRDNYKTNRHLTGMARFGYDARKLPGGLQYYRQSTGPEDNIRLIAQTLFVDFLSPRTLATHEVNQSTYRLSWLEWGIVLMLAWVAVVVAHYFSRGRGRLKNAPAPEKQELRSGFPMALLPAEFFVGYVVITIILWSVGNNDPIYTRFLYPSYPFLILWGFAGYSSVKKRTSSNMALLPFVLLYLSTILINLHKIVLYLK